jgi:hypothetical protein
MTVRSHQKELQHVVNRTVGFALPDELETSHKHVDLLWRAG